MRLHDGLALEEPTSAGWSTRSGCWPTTPTTAPRGRRSRSSAPTTRRCTRSASTHHAGNSGQHDAPWIGRSLRILFVNFERGVGCAMESLGHSLERMATCGALPYYERYFREYAMLDLYRRYGLPFESLYLKGPQNVAYPSPSRASTARLAQAPVETTCRRRQRPLHAQRPRRLRPRRRGPVLSTIETWRQPGRGAAVDARGARPVPRRSRPIAWAAGSSTGARTCRAWTTTRWTTTAAR